MDADLRVTVARILARLPIKCHAQRRLPIIVDTLVRFAVQPTQDDPAYRAIGRAAAIREKRALIRAARNGDLQTTQRVLDSLHAPTINALADVGVLRHHLTQEELPAIAAAAKRATLNQIPEKQGRQRSVMDRYVVILADQLAGNFFALTGEVPTVGTRDVGIAEAYGAFFDVVRAIFAAFRIARNAEAAARAACRRFRVRKVP